MSGKILKRALALCLCMLLLAGSCLAEDSLENFVPDALTEEELAQWQEWAEEGMVDSDATAANAAELTPEEESLMAEMASMLEDTTVSTEVDLSNLEPNEALPDYVVNILLLGVDLSRNTFLHAVDEAVDGTVYGTTVITVTDYDGSRYPKEERITRGPAAANFPRFRQPLEQAGAVVYGKAGCAHAMLIDPRRRSDPAYALRTAEV